MVARSCSGSDLRGRVGVVSCTSRAGHLQGRCSVSSQQPDSLAEQRRGVHKLAQDGGQARQLGEHGSLGGGRGGETQLVSCIEAAEEGRSGVSTQNKQAHQPRSSCQAVQWAWSITVAPR